MFLCLFVVVLCRVCPILPASPYCPFLIVPSGCSTFIITPETNVILAICVGIYWVTMSMNGLPLYHTITNRISGVMHMVIVINSSSAVDIGFDPRWRKKKIIVLIFVLLLRYAGSIKEKEQNLVDSDSIRIICPSGTACISEDCCFSELALWKSY